MAKVDPTDPDTALYQGVANAVDRSMTQFFNARLQEGHDPGAIVAGAAYALVRLCAETITPPVTVRGIFHALLKTINLAAEQVCAAGAARKCRVCGCTNESACVEDLATGKACHWVEEDLCSRCVTVPPSQLQ